MCHHPYMCFCPCVCPAFVAEGDAKRNYDLLWSIDELQDHPETDVVFR